jgi:hypothetical protein
VNNGWVKLHRQILENKMWQYDHNAVMVFMTLLLLADKKKGEWAGGRHQLAERVGLKSTTTYQALKRLEKAKMVTLSSNNKYTVIHLCNYKKFQQRDDKPDDNQMTTRRQPDDTLTRIENKELRNNTNVLGVKPGKPEINDLFSYWEETIGYPISAKKQVNRNACNNLLKRYTQPQIERLIDGVAQAHQDKYAPGVADFADLQSNLNKLLAWGKKQNNQNMEIIS